MISKIYLVILSVGVSLLAGCATSGSTDPRDDNILTSARCALTRDCENYVDQQERDLTAERDEARRLEAQKSDADAELAATDSKIDRMRQSLGSLDRSIASLREQTKSANLEAESDRDAIAEIERELERLQEETQEIEDDVLKEEISIEKAEITRTSLVTRRDELEALIQSILASE